MTSVHVKLTTLWDGTLRDMWYNYLYYSLLSSVLLSLYTVSLLKVAEKCI